MKASEIIEKLQGLIQTHGDRVVKFNERDVIDVLPQTKGQNCLAIYFLRVSTNPWERKDAP